MSSAVHPLYVRGAAPVRCSLIANGLFFRGAVADRKTLRTGQAFIRLTQSNRLGADGSVFENDVLTASIDALQANVAILNHAGFVIAVNDKWRRFGVQRRARSDYVGLNYLDVCADAAKDGDRSLPAFVRVCGGFLTAGPKPSDTSTDARSESSASMRGS
jgi:hypothetical protein